MKPKINLRGVTGQPQGYDACQTPPYAVLPLLPYLSQHRIVWECACGSGQMVHALVEAGLEVIGTDILTGEDFFDWTPGLWDVIVTHPPYSVKYQWLARCCQIGKPFALLLPVETLWADKAQVLFEAHGGLEVIFLNKRVNFYGAQFPMAWFTRRLNIGRQVSWAKIDNRLA